MGDSISLHYRPYLFGATGDAIRFDPNRAERDLLYPKTATNLLIGIVKSFLNGSNLDVPSGLNCGDSRNMLKRLTEYRKYDWFGAELILLNCGLHDIKRDRKIGAPQVEIDEYRNNLLEIIRLLENRRLCWINSTPVINRLHRNKKFDRLESDLDAYNMTAAELFHSANIPVIDLYSFTVNISKKVYVDHVHFCDDVRRKQAAFIAEDLSRHFANV